MMRSIRGLLLLFALAAGAPPSATAAPPASAIRWADIGSATLRYEDSGYGAQTIVLLHELGTSLDTWDYVVASLRRGHRVIRYDLRGFGLSSRIAGALTMADEMADLDALLNRLQVRGKITLVGGAVGGAIALDYAASHPERVQGVIAISPAAYLQARVPGASASPSAGGVAPAALPTPEQLAEASYPARFRAEDPARYARFLALTSGGNPEATRATTAAAYATSFADVLPKIMCPALIVGTSFWIRPASSFRELAGKIVGGRFVELETGHFAAMTSPDLVIGVIAGFLNQRRHNAAGERVHQKRRN